MSFRIHEERLDNNIKKIEEANQLMKKAKELVDEQILMMSGERLKGKSIRAVCALVSILSEQHSKLNAIALEDTKNMKDLLANAQSYMQNGEIPQEWE